MSTGQWVLIAYLALSGLIVTLRGVSGKTVQYGASDAVVGIVEVGLVIWLVTSL